MLADAFDSTWHVAVRFTLSALAVYRLSLLVARENGPWELFRRLRSVASGTMIGRVISCSNCLGMWLSLPFAWFVGSSVVERLVAWWALAGAAVLMDRATRDPFEIETKER